MLGHAFDSVEWVSYTRPTMDFGLQLAALPVREIVAAVYVPPCRSDGCAVQCPGEVVQFHEVRLLSNEAIVAVQGEVRTRVLHH